MGILIRKDNGLTHFTPIAKLSMVSLVVSLSSAFVGTVWAVYLDSFVHSASLVGFISAFLAVVSFVSYFLFIPLVERSDKGKLFAFSLLFLGLFYFLFIFVKNVYFLIFLATISVVIMTLRITSLGLLVKDLSGKRNLSRNEGLRYSFTNMAFVIGPLIVAFALSRFGLGSIFILAGAFSILGFLLFRKSQIKDTRGKKRSDKSMVKNFLAFFMNKDRARAYILGAGVNLWWALIYVFVPLSIIRSGLNQAWVGYFLFMVAVPLILFEYQFAMMAGKSGFGRIFKIGYLIVSVIVIIAFFFSNIFVIMGLLVLASVGMAMLEPTTEAYFFDILKGKEEYRYYGPYNTAITTGDFFGKVLASTLLIFAPFNFVFLLFGGIMFLMFLVSFGVKDIVEDKVRVKK
jgi:MFS family permease